MIPTVARSRDTPLIGTEVSDQRRLRPAAPVRDLDEFLEFLKRLGALAPARGTPTRRPPTTGDRFLL